MMLRAPILFLLSLGLSSLAAGRGDPATTEIHKPIPPKVIPGRTSGLPPSDALVLFNGESLAQWQSVDGSPPQWEVTDGILTVNVGTPNIRTKLAFGDVQLHLEWRTPSLERNLADRETKHGKAIAAEVKNSLGLHQYLTNSGVFLQQRYEVQVLETYELQTYVNGQAGSIYKQHAPLVDASREPGEWQSYDIVFSAPRFSESGALIHPAYMTVFLNGILIQNHVALWGPTEFIGAPHYERHGPAALELQSHIGMSQVSYRNIWIRPL